MSTRLWAALVCFGLAVASMQLVTLAWVPDCGGVSYGFPFPHVQTDLAGSLELDYFVLRFIVDWLAYAALLALPATWLVGRALRVRGLARGATLALLLAPWLTLLLLGVSLALGGYHAHLCTPERLNVHEWRSVHAWFGPPAWDSHVEPACD